MSTKPGRGGKGGGGKQRPQRPQRPSAGKGKPAKPAKPSGSSHPAHPGVVHRRHTTHHAHHGGTGHSKSGKQKRGFTEGVCCCAAEALAMSLRLAGFAVSDRDVLGLYYLTANDPYEGATIEATLAAAAEYGLAGIKPASYRLSEQGTIIGTGWPAPHTVFGDGTGWWSWGERWRPFGDIEEAWELRWQLPGRMI